MKARPYRFPSNPTVPSSTVAESLAFPANWDARRSAFGRLVWLSSRYDSRTRRYVLPECGPSAVEMDQTLRLAHAVAFGQWLGRSLGEQAADLRIYFSEDAPAPTPSEVEGWLGGASRSHLVPEDVLEAERELFEFDLKIVLRLLAREAAPAAALDLLQDVSKTIDTSRVTTKALAGQYGLSVHWLRRLLKTIFGVSFHRLIVTAKMQAAARLLRTTDSPVVVVGASVGYDNSSNFCRDFRKFFGTTATHYRRRWCTIELQVRASVLATQVARPATFEY